MTDRDQVHDVIVRYATGIDSRDWPLLRSCFTDDARFDYGPLGRWDAPDDLVAFMAGSHQGPSLHRLTNVAIALDGDRAEARTYVDAIVTGPGGYGVVRTYGWYDDELRRDADGWRIQHRRTTIVGTRLPGPLSLLPPALAHRLVALGTARRSSGRR